MEDSPAADHDGEGHQHEDEREDEQEAGHFAPPIGPYRFSTNTREYLCLPTR